MNVELNWCDFFVHVHDLLMNLGVVTLVGNRLGHFQDLEMDEMGCSWGSTLCIWVSLDVNLPLKRALKFADDFVDLKVNPPYKPWLCAAVLCGDVGVSKLPQGNKRDEPVFAEFAPGTPVLKGKGKVPVECRFRLTAVRVGRLSGRRCCNGGATIQGGVSEVDSFRPSWGP
ncbi:UNVERIFIED_CONTAM: hypothetical protein Sindi_0909400 [Sesamum indicum]